MAVNTYRDLVGVFADFLSVAIHTILYERDIYPRSSFRSIRRYGFPVRFNRHPGVCDWISDTVRAIQTELLRFYFCIPLISHLNAQLSRYDRLKKNSVERVAVVIYSKASRPLERVVFDLSGFPTIPPSDANTPFEEEDSDVTSLADIMEQLRGAMRKLAFCGSSLTPLPADCTFNVSMELKAGIERPQVDHTSLPWVPVRQSLQPAAASASGAGRASGRDQGTVNRPRAKRKSKVGGDLGGARTTPIRTVESGAFMLEVWVEESEAKVNGLSVASSG
ncbi:hypothetical protein GP486_002385 [Trichoglossum hirsutum]|uniref:HORMA domain-containing protein n=1 Tax=Trichoglossum hirsutum TaxID=265104 RepID=A0A9P8LEW9_9PEZI|nr:hypothetical protein GP486_002385 [Trichoglossum hirsutum]